MAGVSSVSRAVGSVVLGARAFALFPKVYGVAKLIISVSVTGVRALAGPVIGAAVLFASDAKMPRFHTTDMQTNVTRVYSLVEPHRVPPNLLPHVVTHLKKTALAYSLIHRHASRVINSEDTPWAVMAQAAARTAERAAHLHRSDIQVGKEALEIHVPPGGSLPYEFVGKIGQRPVTMDWMRGAAYLLALHAQRTHMISLDNTYPDYGFAAHMGANTPEHRRAIQSYGLTPEHRGEPA